MSLFTESEYRRYTRHLQLPQVGAAGQIKLKNARVLIVGCGGLGAPVSLYLAAAGIGHIALVDGDTIELSNLQRQITFGEADLGKHKAEITAQQLTARNSHIDVQAVIARLDNNNAAELISHADIVLDCTDNFETRYLINQLCRKLGKPWIYASIYQFSGQFAVFTPEGACYQCLYPQAPANAPDCNTGGVLGVLPGILGTLQANECIKYILGENQQTVNKLMLVEALDMSWQSIQLMQDPACPCCGEALSKETLSEKTPSKEVSAASTARSEPSAHTTNSNSQSSNGDDMQELTPEIFQQLANTPGVNVLDVRSAEENAAYNLADLCSSHIHIPLHELVEAAKNETLELDLELDKGQRYAVYCQAGMRGRQAVSVLQQLGYDAINVQGGLQALLNH